MERPIVQYPELEKQLILTTDAFETAVDAVLSKGEKDNDLPMNISYASKLLNVHIKY